jgi:hypothetical protein
MCAGLFAPDDALHVAQYLADVGATAYWRRVGGTRYEFVADRLAREATTGREARRILFWLAAEGDQALREMGVDLFSQEETK